MTREQFDQKFSELSSQIPELLTTHANKIMASGAVDLTAFEDDFILPKAVICACLKEAAWQFHPLSKEGKELARNLEKF